MNRDCLRKIKFKHVFWVVIVVVVVALVGRELSESTKSSKPECPFCTFDRSKYSRLKSETKWETGRCATMQNNAPYGFEYQIRLKEGTCCSLVLQRYEDPFIIWDAPEANGTVGIGADDTTSIQSVTINTDNDLVGTIQTYMTLRYEDSKEKFSNNLQNVTFCVDQKPIPSSQSFPDEQTIEMIKILIAGLCGGLLLVVIAMFLYTRFLYPAYLRHYARTTSQNRQSNNAGVNTVAEHVDDLPTYNEYESYEKVESTNQQPPSYQSTDTTQASIFAPHTSQDSLPVYTRPSPELRTTGPPAIPPPSYNEQ